MRSLPNILTPTYRIPSFYKGIVLSYIDILLAVGGTMSEAHQAATITLWESLEGGSKDFTQDIIELFLFRGETWLSGRMGVKQAYTLEANIYDTDAYWTSVGYEPDATNTGNLRTGINEVTIDSVVEWMVGINTMPTVQTTRIMGNGTDNNEPEFDKQTQIAISHVGNNTLHNFDDGEFLAGIWAATFKLGGGSELYRNGVSVKDSADTFSVKYDKEIWIASTNHEGVDEADGKYSFFCFHNGLWTDVEVAEVNGYFQTWETALGI